MLSAQGGAGTSSDRALQNHTSDIGRMRLWRLSPAAAAPVLLWAVAEAAEFRHLDGVHRIEKKAEITQAAFLEKRQEDGGVCGTSMKLCPSSKEGGCCPDNYDCGVSSCYATTKGPSTCGTKVGWYACAAVDGGKLAFYPCPVDQTGTYMINSWLLSRRTTVRARG